MVIRVRLFAMLRERAGTDALDLDLPVAARVSDVLERVSGLAGGLPLVVAVNRSYAAPEDVLAAGDEVALIPPLSGGAPVHVRITQEPLSIDALSALVGDDGSGAIVVFAGVTRDLAHLDYEAYVEMAHEQIEAIVAAAIVTHGLRAAAVEHRIGRVGLGEPSVIVAVSAAHREEAFGGAREIIDEVKARAPIWKRQEDGIWIEGALPPREG